MTVFTSPAPTSTAVSAIVGGRRGALFAGVLAGPLFVTTALVQILTRDGFDLTRHPISLLANGEYGWVQSANFIVAGLLSLLFAYGVAPHLRASHLRLPRPRRRSAERPAPASAWRTRRSLALTSRSVRHRGS